jgi:hypothetical protein
MDTSPLEWSNEEAQEWAIQCALNYAEENGIPLSREAAANIVTDYASDYVATETGIQIDLSSLSDSEIEVREVVIQAAAAAVQYYTGVDFRLVQVTVESLWDGELDQNEVLAISATAGSIAGAAIGQAFGVPFPIGAFIGGWIGGLIGEALVTGFGIGPSRSELHARQRAEQMAQLEEWHAEASAQFRELVDSYHAHFEHTVLDLENSWTTLENELNISFTNLKWFDRPPPEGIPDLAYQTDPDITGIDWRDPSRVPCVYDCINSCTGVYGCQYPRPLAYESKIAILSSLDVRLTSFTWLDMQSSASHDRIFDANLPETKPGVFGAMSDMWDQLAINQAQYAATQTAIERGEPIRDSLRTTNLYQVDRLGIELSHIISGRPVDDPASHERIFDQRGSQAAAAHTRYDQFGVSLSSDQRDRELVVTTMQHERWAVLANALVARAAFWDTEAYREEHHYYLPPPSMIMITDGPARAAWQNDIVARFNRWNSKMHTVNAARTKVLGDLVQTAAVNAAIQELETPDSVTIPERLSRKRKPFPTALLLGGGVAVVGGIALASRR